jgi:hypothetical protein
MAVSLQEFVAIFIAALYNLCKTYLGNRPLKQTMGSGLDGLLPKALFYNILSTKH